MRICILIFVSLCLWAVNASARIYKHVDKDGNITYTDVPDSTTDKVVKEKPMTTFKPVTIPTTTNNNDEKSKKSSTVTYDSLSITSPRENDIIRANSGTITVAVRSLPGLNVAEGHQYVILVDGTPQPPSQSNSISVSNLPRGKHNISVQIQDNNDHVLISSDPVQVDILRASIQNPNHPARRP